MAAGTIRYSEYASVWRSGKKMLPSSSRDGCRTAWCSTHARIHSLRTASGLSLRDSRAGAFASGQVCATASATNNPNVHHDFLPSRIECLSIAETGRGRFAIGGV